MILPLPSTCIARRPLWFGSVRDYRWASVILPINFFVRSPKKNNFFVRNCPPQTHQLIGTERCQRTRGSLRRLATQERNVPRNASLDILQVGTHLGHLWRNFRGSGSACARTVRSCTSLCAARNRLRRLSPERSLRSYVFGAPAGSVTVPLQGRSQSRRELRQTCPYTTILCYMNSA